MWVLFLEIFMWIYKVLQRQNFGRHKAEPIWHLRQAKLTVVVNSEGYKIPLRNEVAKYTGENWLKSTMMKRSHSIGWNRQISTNEWPIVMAVTTQLKTLYRSAHLLLIGTLLLFMSSVLRILTLTKHYSTHGVTSSLLRLFFSSFPGLFVIAVSHKKDKEPWERTRLCSVP